MKIHRFLVERDFQLSHEVWLRDESILWQWNKVLRLSPNQNIILFNGQGEDRLYRILKLNSEEAHLLLVNQLVPIKPKVDLYVFWSLLKRSNNELILQKCTELGVSHFVPLISERTIKKDFNIERAQKIIREASEQCGRSLLPTLRSPIKIDKALAEYTGEVEIVVCSPDSSPQLPSVNTGKKLGIMIGPEGGWSESEINVFRTNNLPSVGLGKLVLRAETAAIVAASKMLA